MPVFYHCKSRNFTRIKIKLTNGPEDLVKPIDASEKFNMSKFLDGILKNVKLIEEKHKTKVETTTKVVTDNYDFLSLVNKKLPLLGAPSPIMRQAEDKDELMYDIEDDGLRMPL